MHGSTNANFWWLSRWMPTVEHLCHNILPFLHEKNCRFPQRQLVIIPIEIGRCYLILPVYCSIYHQTIYKFDELQKVEFLLLLLYWTKQGTNDCIYDACQSINSMECFCSQQPFMAYTDKILYRLLRYADVVFIMLLQIESTMIHTKPRTLASCMKSRYPERQTRKLFCISEKSLLSERSQCEEVQLLSSSFCMKMWKIQNRQKVAIGAVTQTQFGDRKKSSIGKMWVPQTGWAGEHWKQPSETMKFTEAMQLTWITSKWIEQWLKT